MHGGGHGHDDHNSHDHGHSHEGAGHVHGPGPGATNSAFAIAAGLNSAYVVAQIVYGLAAHSMSLLADAAHNSADVLGLFLAWAATWAGRRPPSASRTYGWGRSTILAALINAVVLLIGVGAIALEAVQRFFDPQPIGTRTVMFVALLGILVNGGTALMFMRGRKGDLNIRASFLHLAGDAAVSLGVVLSALAIAATGWLWLDPLTSLVIAGLIIATTWGVLRGAAHMAMDGVPEGIDRDEVERFLADQPGVAEVHDLHIWSLSTTQTALTAHLVSSGSGPGGLLAAITHAVHERFGIDHATFQIETPEESAACALRPAEVV